MQDRNKKSVATVVLRDFSCRSLIGRVGYLAGIVLFMSSNVGIDGTVPHHNWLAPLAVLVIVGSGRWRRKREMGAVRAS